MDIKKIFNSAIYFTLRRIIELFSVVLAGLSLLLVISLVSYSPDDPNFIFPDNTGDVLSNYKKVIIPELNTGQLIKLVRERYLIDAIGINKVNAEPFTAQELYDGIEERINE